MPGHNGLFARQFPIAFRALCTGPSRVLPTPVRPVLHQSAYLAIVVGLLLEVIVFTRRYPVTNSAS